jgi:SAM-dependent methyltransferase
MNFTYWGAKLEGFDHPYNDTIRNERAVEVAVALQWLAGRDGAGLEVGNVLGHYGATGHRVVDRWEKAPGVENRSVFDIAGSFDWIVSLSTLEHVGWDVEPRTPDAASKALAHLYGLLNPGGSMLVTVPFGYHPTFDEHLLTGAGAARCASLVRHGKSWRQTKTITPKPYGHSTPWAESVWIGEYEA